MDPVREAAAESEDEPGDFADGDSASREADVRDVELGGVDVKGGDFDGDEGAEEDTAVEQPGGDESFIRRGTASSGGEGGEERTGLAGCRGVPWFGLSHTNVLS